VVPDGGAGNDLQQPFAAAIPSAHLEASPARPRIGETPSQRWLTPADDDYANPALIALLRAPAGDATEHDYVAALTEAAQSNLSAVEGILIAVALGLSMWSVGVLLFWLCAVMTRDRHGLGRDAAILRPEMPLVHVIDDDKAVRESLSMLLESAGLSVQTYASATAFLGALPKAGVGCVLTDVQMPGLNGLELQRRLTRLGITLPVIVMTGQADVPIAVEALKAGAVDFLEKPLDDVELLAALSSALSASVQAHEKPSSSPELRSGPRA
jgi:CheY-like chemotaxis protein